VERAISNINRLYHNLIFNPEQANATGPSQNH